MNDWAHGYDVSVEYSFGFYREMAPDWLDLCARVNGHRAPRRSGSPFRYLELGCGQGFGLCLLAAANPGAQFVGVDFQAEHVAHACELAAAAGLDNVRFIEADFADLAVEWPEDFGTFDYVTLHGIVSWVSPELRDAVIRCLGHATHRGSLVYVSYNVVPSWLGTVPFQHVARMIKQSSGDAAGAVLDRSIDLFERLRAANAAGFKLLPALGARLDTMRGHSLSYLAHEYLGENWQPLWHSEVAKALAGTDLAFVGSATITDNLMPGILPAPLRQIVVEQADEALRQDVLDFAINQGFRRDIFCREPERSGGAGAGAASGTRLRLVSPPERGSPVNVQTSFGTMTLEPRHYSAIVDALSAGPATIEQLAGGRTDADVLTLLLLLLQADVIAIDAARRGPADAAERFNAIAARRACSGAAYEHVAAAALGSAIRVSQIEMVLIDSWRSLQGEPDLAAVARAVGERLRALGQKLYRDGQVVDEADGATQLEALASVFMQNLLPKWRELGVLE